MWGAAYPAAPTCLTTTSPGTDEGEKRFPLALPHAAWHPPESDKGSRYPAACPVSCTRSR